MIVSTRRSTSRRCGRRQLRPLPGQESEQILELPGRKALIVVGGHQAFGFDVDAAQLGPVERMKPLVIPDHLQGISILIQQNTIDYFSVGRSHVHRQVAVHGRQGFQMGAATAVLMVLLLGERIDNRAGLARASDVVQVWRGESAPASEHVTGSAMAFAPEDLLAVRDIPG